MKTKKSLLFIFFTVIFILTSHSGSAQFPIDTETGKVKFTGIIDLSGSKDKIYKKAKLWIVSTLKSGDNMVELGGDNSDQIIGTGNILIDSLKFQFEKKYYAREAHLNFKFIIFCKDNKLKYSVENFILTYSYSYDKNVETGLENIKLPDDLMTKKDLEIFKTEGINYLKRKIDELISNFIYSMKKDENKDW